MMGHDHKHSSRRDFLKLFGTSTGIALYQTPLQILIEAIVMGASRTAVAEELGLQPRNYVHILQEGGPPRWMFDLFLTPYNTSNFTETHQIGTAFDSSGVLKYRTISHTTSQGAITLPHMWQFEVAKSGGGMRDMRALLDNYLQLRGIEVGNPDHGAAQSMQFLPTGATHSMTSLAADLSKLPIPAVNLSVPAYQMISQNLKSAINVSNSGNMLSNMLGSFNSATSMSFKAKRAQLDSALDAAVEAIDAAAKAVRPGVETSSGSLKAAKDLLSTGFGNISTDWTNLVAKYEDVIRRSIGGGTRSLPGINDMSIISDGSNKFAIGNTPVTSGTNLNATNAVIKSSATVNRLAAHFAVTEYVLKNKLSSTISISPNAFVNFKHNTNEWSWLGHDEHDTGCIISTYLNVHMNLAIAGCLLELIDVLKSTSHPTGGNLFNETVIMLGGEFGRTPQSTGFGTDHAHLGSSFSIFSGALSGATVLGNIKHGGAAGTYGEAAAVNVGGLTRKLNLGDWASTIAYLLRAPSPTTAASSLVVSSPGGELVPTIAKGTQVA